MGHYFLDKQYLQALHLEHIRTIDTEDTDPNSDRYAGPDPKAQKDMVPSRLSWKTRIRP